MAQRELKQPPLRRVCGCDLEGEEGECADQTRVSCRMWHPCGRAVNTVPHRAKSANKTIRPSQDRNPAQLSTVPMKKDS